MRESNQCTQMLLIKFLFSDFTSRLKRMCARGQERSWDDSQVNYSLYPLTKPKGLLWVPQASNTYTLHNLLVLHQGFNACAGRRPGKKVRRRSSLKEAGMKLMRISLCHHCLATTPTNTVQIFFVVVAMNLPKFLVHLTHSLYLTFYFSECSNVCTYKKVVFYEFMNTQARGHSITTWTG